MAPDDPQDSSEGAATRGSADAGDRPQDPIVERLRPDPAQPPEPTLTMSGFLGDSDRPGFRRLYFTRELNYYAEFRFDDVVDMAEIPAEERPFRGDQATRVVLRREATVDYTRTHTAQKVDEFDLDIRFGQRQRSLFKAELPFLTPDGTCGQDTCWKTQCAVDSCAPEACIVIAPPATRGLVTCGATECNWAACRPPIKIPPKFPR